MRSSKYPALTAFYKTKMCNYIPTIGCPKCGKLQLRHPDERHVYFCDHCESEFYRSYYDNNFIYIERVDLHNMLLDED